MKPLETLKGEIKDALNRGGSGGNRRVADEEVARKSAQGMRKATESRVANDADFARHYEDWHGEPPVPLTPREDPHHAAKAKRGRVAEQFLFILKIVFWVIFGPAYFSVLAWAAVIIALAISVPLSLGVKPLVASLILKPGLTPQQQEKRLHAHVVAGLIAFAISFGGLFLLRGLAGPLAVVGALLVLPLLSLCDLVLLFLMGTAHAYAQLYGWAAPFVINYHDFTTDCDEFEHQSEAARNRLRGYGQDGTAQIPVSLGPVPGEPGRGAQAAIPAGEPQGSPSVPSRLNGPTVMLAVMIMALSSAIPVRAQTARPAIASVGAVVSQNPNPVGEAQIDSTSSVYPTISATITPILASSFYAWAGQLGVHRLRVSAFERDGWLPRIITEVAVGDTPSECTPSGKSEGSIFRGIDDILQRKMNEACRRAKATNLNRIQTDLTKAIAGAWRSEPLADRKHSSCTAFNDALAAAAHAPAGNLIALVSDTEDSCSKELTAPPETAGGTVIIILIPSRADMGPGVSASARFNAKRAQILRIAPWLAAVLAPAEVESYRLPTSMPPLMKVSRERH